MSNILAEAKFGVYELFANIIPGGVLCSYIVFLLTYFNLITYDVVLNIINFKEVFIIMLFSIVSFILGQMIQAWSSIITDIIYKKIGGYPSSKYFDKKDKTFSDYFKDTLKRYLIDNKSIYEKSDSQEIFDLCYTHIVQNKISVRVITFLHMYEFSKNMFGTMLIITISSCLMIIYIQNTTYYIFITAMACFTMLFYHNFVRYGNSFSKEVLRSYYTQLFFKK